MEAAEVLQRQLDAAQRKIDELEKDNKSQRDELRDANDLVKAKDGEIEGLKSKVPPQDALVLTGKKLEQYRAFEGLKLEPDVIKQRLESETEKDGRLMALERRERATRAAGETYLVEPILESLPADADFEESEAVVDGKTVKVWQVKQGDTAKPLGEWVDSLKAAKPYITFERDASTPIVVLPQAGPRQPNKTDAGAEHRKSRHGYKKKG